MERFARHLTRRAIRRAVVIALASTAVACDRTPQPPSLPTTTTTTTSAEWREFTGSWNATGTRHMIPLGDDRKGSIVDLSGSMLLAGEGRPGIGFRSEVIVLVDSKTGLVGRGVWTDEKGDQVFSELKGEGTKENNHIVGTILGGTGRYGGLVGSYEFSWQYVIESEAGSIQGRAVGLKGRVRAGPTTEESSKP